MKWFGPLLLLAAVSFAGCQAPLPHAASGPDALAQDLLAALERKDRQRLRELAVSDREFFDIVWPELPAARPERNLSPEYVWAGLRTKSEAGLQRVLAEHGGRSYEFVRLTHEGAVTQHRTFVVRRQAVVVVRDSEGQERSLHLFGSTLERAGRFKVFSYVVDSVD
jgi:hypothetical protein